MNYRLEKLIDIPLLQNLQDKLNEIYSFPSAIIDNDGKVLTAVAWQDICTKFHRANPECAKECIKSDKYIIDHLHEANPAVSYQCPHGLVDNATPIIIDGRHLGNFFTGQFFLEKPDLEFFRQQAKKYGFNEKAYLEAVQKVPIWTKKKRSQYLDFIKGFIEIIAGLGLKNLREAEANNALRESELKYRSLIENSDDAVYCVNEEGEYQFTNLFFSSVFDKTPDYFIGKTLWDVFNKENADTRYKVIKRVFQTGISESSEVKAELPQKTLIFLATYCPIKDEKGKVILILTHATDITELKKPQKELEELIALNSNIINSARSGIIVYDKNLRYKIWNPFMEYLSGVSASDVIGKHPLDVFPFLEENGVFANLEKALKGEIVDTIDFPFEFTKTGKKGWISDCNAPIRDSDGKIFGVIGTVHDITDRKSREEEAERAKMRAEESEKEIQQLYYELQSVEEETMASNEELKATTDSLVQTNIELEQAMKKAEEGDRLKSAFLSNMSHEIRTPMNGILGFTELLKKPNLTGEKQRQFIDIIEKSGKRMLNTINNIVDISKIESGMMKVYTIDSNINEQLQFAYSFFKPEAEKKGLQLTLRCGLPADRAVIKTDNEKLYSVLFNLLKNAIKFTENGLVEFGYDLMESNLSERQQKDYYLQFFVKDTGIGISKNQQETIFDRFIQAESGDTRVFEGTGLGLSIAKSYIEMLNGRIWVESDPGKGSIFYFILPFTSVSIDERELKEMVYKKPIKKLKVLIAEDDVISRELLQMQIEELCKEILYAENGVDAVEICRNNPDIDLVLMDIQMPIMFGYEAATKIRQFNKDVIIIAQTAFGFSTELEKAISAGCNDYVSKPINYPALIEKIKKLL